ncbi:unnamed protein product [Lota lota]
MKHCVLQLYVGVGERRGRCRTSTSTSTTTTTTTTSAAAAAAVAAPMAPLTALRVTDDEGAGAARGPCGVVLIADPQAYGTRWGPRYNQAATVVMVMRRDWCSGVPVCEWQKGFHHGLFRGRFLRGRSTARLPKVSAVGRLVVGLQRVLYCVETLTCAEAHALRQHTALRAVQRAVQRAGEGALRGNGFSARG